ncbi:hypothetical protein RhiirA5_434628 [Rhizophagus irregularis]|uniref:Uncharacterized protein n=1 Tax=Rhizophagus irregularis TaxID=588596 RepID=A0A2N0NPQ2_9GLOM|nr:hypothetical protein RhiirA5_434628 [Rhizophagus irregularis]
MPAKLTLFVYLKVDERIDNKAKKIRTNSNVMILGKMIFVNSEFQVKIQDINFITMMNTNIGNSADNSISSLYSTSSSNNDIDSENINNDDNLTSIKLSR